MKIDKSLVSGSTTLLILKLLKEQDLYGYQMIERLEQRSQNVFTLKAGTLYPLLHTLENQDFVESYETTGENGKARKTYRLTSKGGTLLEEKKREWHIYSEAMGRLIGGTES